MNKEDKIKLARQGMWISGIFSLLVASMLILNFIQLKQYEPFESETLKVLVEHLKDDPRNDQLKLEIRDFDLMVRKAFFTSSWQVKVGGWLLLFSSIIFAMSLRILTKAEHRITEPVSSGEHEVSARITSHRWLLITGVFVIVMALVAAYFSNDYLTAYYNQPPAVQSPEVQDESIEVITITEASDSAAVPESQDVVMDENEIEVDQLTETPTPEEAVSEKVFGIAEHKSNQSTFRGFFGQGISYHKNIPTAWDGATGKNIKWKLR